jgi:hypothetical protein
MARPLRLAIIPEGPTDVRFFTPLLRRLVMAQDGLRPCDVPSDVLDLSSSSGLAATRAERIRDAVSRAEGSFDLLFVHADGASDPLGKRREQVDPGILAAGPWLPRRAAVGLVPVREMEAWALADGDAIRRALQTSKTDADLAIPQSADRVADPKEALNAVVCAAHPGAKRRRARSGADYLEVLGDAVSLDALRRLPAFQALEEELREALIALRFL